MRSIWRRAIFRGAFGISPLILHALFITISNILALSVWAINCQQSRKSFINVTEKMASQAAANMLHPELGIHIGGILGR